VRSAINGSGKWKVVAAVLLVSRALAALLVLAAPLALARAEERPTQLTPEVDVYAGLSQTTRMFLFWDIARNTQSDTADGDFGAHVDFTLVPRRRLKLRAADWARERYLWVRIGYEHSRSLDGVSVGGPTEVRSIENRLELEMTARAQLPQDLWVSLRTRVELRDINNQIAERYRLRLNVEREFTVHNTVMAPYVQAETFYDTRYDIWNRQVYQAGDEIELAKAWRIEVNCFRQNDKASPSANVNGVGLQVKWYH
jgi:hypothetical protein